MIEPAQSPAPALTQGNPHVPDAKVQVGTRLLTPTVAEKLREAMKAYAPEDATPDPVADPDTAPTVPDPAPEPGTPEEVPGQPANPQDIPPHVLDAAIRVSQAQQALDRQKAEWKAQFEQLEKFQGVKSKLPANRLEAMKEALSYLTDEDPDDALFGLVEDYTRQVLGVEPSSDQRALSETAKVRAEIQALRREQAETKQKALEDDDRKRREYDEREAVSTVGQVLAETSSKFPYLHALGTGVPEGAAGPAELVWQEIKDEHARTGQTLSVHDAALRVNQAFEERLKPFRSLLSGLVSETPPKAPRPTSERPRSVSQSLQSAPATPVLENRPLTPEEKRAQTLSRIGRALRGQ